MHDNVVVKQRVNAPVEKVWNALTDKSEMKNWYFDIPDFELGVHNEFNFYEPGGENKFHHHGEILEIEPNAKLKHTWSYPEFSKEKTLVKWELERDGDATNVTLTHKGLENFDHLGKDFGHESFEAGWKELVGKSLKDYVEK
ncbi:SRPBCC domain-containing protein [uncultured Chryseobacterium sp.]|mgnify:CR=1 FL=1|uniref:SRPBCC family protein n=1 Tax=uncultured Chryseobacterium sp. TaxID=259322 RepID=UPI00260552CE|nr:SRPBCC domain-containing protein [uncultured Chryseobacterium sp.]